MSIIIMGYSTSIANGVSFPHYSYFNGLAIRRIASLSCDCWWLAWWQLLFDTVVFKYRLVTVALVLVPLTRDSRILSESSWQWVLTAGIESNCAISSLSCTMASFHTTSGVRGLLLCFPIQNKFCHVLFQVEPILSRKETQALMRKWETKNTI